MFIRVAEDEAGSARTAVFVSGLMEIPRVFCSRPIVTRGDATLTVPFPLVVSDPDCVYVNVVVEGTLATWNVPSKVASFTPPTTTFSPTVIPWLPVVVMVTVQLFRTAPFEDGTAIR